MSNFSSEEIARFQAYLSHVAASGASSAGSSTQALGFTQASQPTSSYAPQSSQVMGPSSLTQTIPAPSHSLPQIPRPGIPPITQLYHSQQHGHPAHPSSQAPVFNPFIGTGIGLPNTSLANQARLASASSRLPRQPSLARRGRRQGAAPQAAVLPLRVFPPVNESKQNYLIYQTLQNSVDSWLEEHHLLYRYELSVSTTHQSVIEMVSAAMQSSAMQYQFPPPRDTSLASHEALPLQPLGLVARGIPRRTDGRVCLRLWPLRQGHLLSDIMFDNIGFAGKACIEDNTWALYFVISCTPISFIRDNYRHCCLSYWFYRRFSDDNGTLPPSRIQADDDSSGGEALTDDEAMPIDQPVTQLPAPQGLMSQASFIRDSRFLPSEIWAATWEQPPSGLDPVTSDDFAQRVYEGAGGDPNDTLLVTGRSINELVASLGSIISECAISCDFTPLLLSSRMFQITATDHIETFGEGIEREVIHTAFKQHLDAFSTWFCPRYDDRASLQTTCGIWRAMSGTISENRIQSMTRLGTICALMLINGNCPSPLSPLIFHFIINNCDFNSLHRGLIQEWHPTLSRLLEDWLNTGSEGSLEPFRAHFASYHDMDISVLHHRDDASHKALAPEILYYAIFGSEPPFHPEWKAFIEGFSLKCRNGFSFLKIMAAFEGGSESFISLSWTATVTGPENVEKCLIFFQPLATFTRQLRAAIQEPSTLRSLIETFLRGTGIPCPGLFADVREGFSPLVDLDTIDSPTFRSRIFLWAATGTPATHSRTPDGGVMIHISMNTDPLYGTDANRAFMMSQGKVSFRTCAREARLPGSYILDLARVVYSSSTEPHTFFEAFEHWFLCEIITAVGGHTML